MKLWVRRKRGNRKLVCSGCERKFADAYDSYEREVRDLPCFEYRTTVVVELYRVRCPECCPVTVQSLHCVQHGGNDTVTHRSGYGIIPEEIVALEMV